MYLSIYTPLRELTALPRPPSCIKGPNSKGREGKGEGEGRREGRRGGDLPD